MRPTGLPGQRTTAITANDLDRRAFLEPCFCAFDASVVQNIDDRLTLEIDHDRAGPRGMPAPIINAHNPNIVLLHGRRMIALQLPQDRVVANRHAEPMH